jgi:tetratricopeptide (TPR) repeat protein
MFTNITYIPDSMETKKVIKAALFLGILVSCIGIPVFAYSADAIGLFDQGNAFMKNKTYSEALRVYDKAITIEPEYYEAWNGKADALNRAQQFNEALKASDRVLILKPDYVPGWINRGYILYNLGLYDEELKAYETAITFDPASPEAWFNKGYSLAGMKRYDEAIASFNKVESLDPTYPNLAANKRIAEQNRNATTSYNASEKTPLTTPAQSQIKISPTLQAGTGIPAISSTKPEPTQSPVSVGAVIGILSMMIIARQIEKGKKW